MEWFGVIIILAIYFLPSFVAAGREPKHNSPGGVFVLNLFLGWTLVGWVIALAWASSNTAKTTKSIVNVETMSVGSELTKLVELRDQGILNELEFEEQKQKLLEKE